VTIFLLKFDSSKKGLKLSETEDGNRRTEDGMEEQYELWNLLQIKSDIENNVNIQDHLGVDDQLTSLFLYSFYYSILYFYSRNGNRRTSMTNQDRLKQWNPCRTNLWITNHF
jgi:hypothetical protein